MSGDRVRQQFMKEFRGFDKTSRNMAIAIVAGFFIQTLGAMGLGYWLWLQPASLATMLGLGVVVLFIATRYRGFNNIVHECSHATFSDRRDDNAILGSICAATVFSCFRDYRDEHLTHHAHLGDYEKDMDLHGIRDLRLEDPLTPKTVLRHFLTPLLGLHLPYYLSVNLSAKDGIIFLAQKFVLIGLALAATFYDPMAALVLIWAPFLWVYTALNYWTDCIDHGGLIESSDELESSRNVLLPKSVAAIFFPRNDCYHLVHHLFPQVPTKHYDTCHELLLSNPDYAAKNGAKTAPELPQNA